MRIAKKMTVDELDAIINDYDPCFHNIDTDQEKHCKKYGLAEKDLLKVSFDNENHDAYSTTEQKYVNLIKESIRTLDNGLTCAFFRSGGDWEWPLIYILYVDNKNKVRAYIPTEGNPWNTTNKCAYGNDEKADSKNLQKRLKIKKVDMPESGLSLEDAERLENIELMIHDIQKRIMC